MPEQGAYNAGGIFSIKTCCLSVKVAAIFNPLVSKRKTGMWFAEGNALFFIGKYHLFPRELDAFFDKQIYFFNPGLTNDMPPVSL